MSSSPSPDAPVSQNQKTQNHKAAALSDQDEPVTSWAHVFILFFAGVILATQIGKVPAAIPIISEDLRVNLVVMGWIVSTFNLIAACCGMALGGFADSMGYLRVAIFGMILAACANFAGSLSEGANFLLFSRALEGFGFIITSVCIPPLIMHYTSSQHRRLALGLWGAYLPTGSFIMLVASPYLIDAFGWRGLWQVTGACILLWALMFLVTFRPSKRRPALAQRHTGSLLASLQIMRSAPALVVSGIFMSYAGMYLAVTSFLPVMMIEQNGFSLASAATLGAFVVVSNVVGNIAAGFLLNAGWRRVHLLSFAGIMMGLTALGIFYSGLPFEIRYLMALLFIGIGGLIPGTLLASAPHYAPHPALVGSMIGLLMQGAGIGQFLCPPLMIGIVEFFGNWTSAMVFTTAGSGIILILAMAAAKLKPRQPAQAA